MSRKRLAAAFIPLILALTAAAPDAFAAPTGSTQSAKKPANMSEGLAVLHTVSQWASGLSAMADSRAKSELVKNYARETTANSSGKDAKIKSIAKQEGIELAPPNPQTEEGKSLLDRMKAETALLGSLQGDAFDKEYMTLVTNTQQSLIRYLQTQQASATNQEYKQLLSEMSDMVQNRLKVAQNILANVYGDTV